jgi:hypothetical protein
VFGGPLFIIVATATAAVMAVGMVAMTVERLLRSASAIASRAFEPRSRTTRRFTPSARSNAEVHPVRPQHASARSTLPERRTRIMRASSDSRPALRPRVFEPACRLRIRQELDWIPLGARGHSVHSRRRGTRNREDRCGQISRRRPSYSRPALGGTSSG